MQYDKKRITSTVILTIFLLLSLVISIPFFFLSWTALKEGASDDVAGSFAVIFGSFAIILAFLVHIGAIITCSICLPFAVANRKSVLAGVRVYSYILDGLFGALILASIVKMVLLIMGI